VLVHVASSAQAAWLIALLLVWALLLVGGFALGRPNAERTRRMPAWTRIGSSLTLVVAAWSWYAVVRGGPAESFCLLVAVGMTLGWVGDLFMAGVLPLRQPVLGGIAAFGLGHVAYIAALLRLAAQAGLTAPGPLWGAWVAWLIVGGAGWYLVVLRGHKPDALRWAALPYALLLASTAGFATSLALQVPALVPVALGGALFLLSDLILAGELFGGLRSPLIGDAVWLLYGPAQALIVYAVAAATVMPGRG
jgi:hypothetical protein